MNDALVIAMIAVLHGFAIYKRMPLHGRHRPDLAAFFLKSFWVFNTAGNTMYINKSVELVACYPNLPDHRGAFFIAPNFDRFGVDLEAS